MRAELQTELGFVTHDYWWVEDTGEYVRQHLFTGVMEQWDGSQWGPPDIQKIVERVRR